MDLHLAIICFVAGLFVGLGCSTTTNEQAFNDAIAKCTGNQGVHSLETGAPALNVSVTCKNGAVFKINNRGK
ncbi:MAG TPA: hypothetical protein VM783_17615 [Candidatus Acidoferrum sp.]|nr:hypothetical protein [Candidatus Acidoferrum sp.]